jgi:hypothetical protein
MWKYLTAVGKHTLQFRASEILNDILPVRRVIVSSQIWLQFSAQNLQGCALSDTVGADQSQNLSRARCWQSMKLEAVGRVSMGNVRFEVSRQIDNIDGTEWALLWTDTASNTKTLGDKGDLGFGGDFDTETPTSHNRARFLAFLSAFLYGITQCMVVLEELVTAYLWLTLIDETVVSIKDSMWWGSSGGRARSENDRTLSVLIMAILW